MILSTRPTDRRQLIEEAAGVTKYKARRRAGELKLEAAQQNLTRIDDIVFEVEKQRGTLKRQAGEGATVPAAARRAAPLGEGRSSRASIASWPETIESARAPRRRRASARPSRRPASARSKSDLGRLRIELVEAESRSTRVARGRARLRARRSTASEQQIAFDREQVQTLEARAANVAAELEGLEAPARARALALARRRDAAAAANADRDRAGDDAGVRIGRLRERASRARRAGSRRRSGARRGVLGAQLGDGAAARARARGGRARSRRRNAVEARCRRRAMSGSKRERVGAERAAAAEGLRRAHDAIEATRIARAARESELASAHASSTNGGRDRSAAREQELAGLEARLRSLEELDAARAGYGDAARTVLVQANGKVSQQGAIADYLEVEAGLRARGRSLPRRSAPACGRRAGGACVRRLPAGARSAAPAAAAFS